MKEYRIESISVVNNKVYYDIWTFTNKKLTNLKKQIKYEELPEYGKRLEPNFIAEYIYDLSECRV